MNTTSIRKSVMLVTAAAFVLLGVMMVFGDEPGPTYTPSPRHYDPSPSPSHSPSPPPSPSVSPSPSPSVSPYPTTSPVIGGDTSKPWIWIGIVILVLLLLFLLISKLRHRKPTGYSPHPNRPGGGPYAPVDQKGPDQY